MMKTKIFYILLVIVLMVVTLFAACNDQAFDPFEDETGLFSFYGLLKAGFSPTYIRVKDLNEPFLSGPKELDYTVTFEDLDAGTLTTLKDTLVEFGGNFTRNFIITEQIEQDRLYRLKAETADGFITQSTVKTPKNTEVFLNPVREEYGCETFIDITFKNVVYPEFIDMEFTFEGGDIFGNFDVNYWAKLNLFKKELKRIDGTDEVNITLRPRDLLTELYTPIFRPDDSYRTFPDVYCERRPSSDRPYILNGTITVDYIHFDGNWAEASQASRTIVVGAGGIENGIGFLGAIHEGSFTISW